MATPPIPPALIGREDLIGPLTFSDIARGFAQKYCISPHLSAGMVALPVIGKLGLHYFGNTTVTRVLQGALLVAAGAALLLQLIMCKLAYSKLYDKEQGSLVTRYGANGERKPRSTEIHEAIIDASFTGNCAWLKWALATNIHLLRKENSRGRTPLSQASFTANIFTIAMVEEALQKNPAPPAETKENSY